MSTLCKNVDLSLTWKGSLAVPTAMKQVFLSRLQILHLRQPKTVQVGPFEKKKKSLKVIILVTLKWVQHPQCLFYVGVSDAKTIDHFVRLSACLVQFLFLFLLGIKPNSNPNPKLRP